MRVKDIVCGKLYHVPDLKIFVPKPFMILEVIDSKERFVSGKKYIVKILNDIGKIQNCSLTEGFIKLYLEPCNNNHETTRN